MSSLFPCLFLPPSIAKTRISLVSLCCVNLVPFYICRYKHLSDPLQERRGSLEASRLQYQFFRDVDDELAWVHEKLPLASSKDYGQSLTTVQSLQEKHQVK